MLAALLFTLAQLVAVAQPARAQGPPPISWIGGGTIGIQGVAVSPNGQTIATAAQDNTVKLWGASDHRLIRTLTAHNGGVNSVAFTPDGAFLASGGEFVFGDPSRNIKLWRAADGAFIRDFAVPDTAGLAYSVAVSPDGTLLATGQSSGQVLLFRISDGALVRTLNGHTDQVFSVAFAPNGATLASGSADRTVRIWRVSDGRRLRTLTGHTFFVMSVAFSPDGTTLASGSFDGTVRLYRTTNFGLLRTLNHTDSVNAVAFSADSRVIASGGGDVAVRLWQVSNGALLRSLAGSEKHFVSSLRFSGSATVVVAGFDGHIRLWRAADGALQATFGEHTGGVRTVAFAPNGTLLASAADDTTAKLWRTADGTVAQTLIGHIDVINAVAFSPDSSLVATAAGSPGIDNKETTIKIWNATSGALLRTLPGHEDGSTGVAFTADGSTIISSGRDFTLRFWRVADGSLIRAVTNGQPIGALAISPDRTVVAVPGRTFPNIRIYSTVDGTLLRTALASTGVVSSLSFSGDNTLLAVGEEAYGNNVEVFRVSDAALVRTFAGDPNGFVQGVAFAPNSATVASSSGFTHLIQLWDPATGTLRTSYDRETGWGPFVHLPLAYSPDGTQIGYGRGDATVVLARP
jgi:WD40 repeat protein